MIKTSLSHPIRIDSVTPTAQTGVIGMTFCPGKKQSNALSGGEWDRDIETDVAALIEWGATTLLNLIEDHEMRELQVVDLPLALKGKLDYFRLPIVDGGIPDANAEKAWCALGTELRFRIVQRQRIVIHCKGGLGRTGTMAARLLVELGEDPDDAIRRVRAARHGAIENSLQEAYVRACHRC